MAFQSNENDIIKYVHFKSVNNKIMGLIEISGNPV